MKRKIILFNGLLIFFIVNLFSENTIRIPKARNVYIKTINTIESNEKNMKKFNENDYPRITKDKILINRISFYDMNENLLVVSDKMEINNILFNNASNIFLCLRYDDILKTEKKNSLYLFDFTEGIQEQIDVDVHTYSLSNDGKQVFYVTKFRYPESMDFYFTIFENKKRKTKVINYKQFTNELCDSIKIKQENEYLSLYLYQDACVILKLYFDYNCNIVHYALPKYDENIGVSYIINPEGNKEYLNKQ